MCIVIGRAPGRKFARSCHVEHTCNSKYYHFNLIISNLMHLTVKLLLHLNFKNNTRVQYEY